MRDWFITTVLHNHDWSILAGFDWSLRSFDDPLSTLEGLLSVLMQEIQNLHITEIEECRKLVRRTENYPRIAECQNKF